jgi:hypothetical protein
MRKKLSVYANCRRRRDAPGQGTTPRFVKGFEPLIPCLLHALIDDSSTNSTPRTRALSKLQAARSHGSREEEDKHRSNDHITRKRFELEDACLGLDHRLKFNRVRGLNKS